MKPLARLTSTVLALFLTVAGYEVTAAGAQESIGDLDIKVIRRIVGIEGEVKDGAYKVSVPQNDLGVTVDEFRIIPPMGTSTWVAFTPSRDGAVLMGDVVVTEEEVAPVQRALIEHGLTITALHKHFVRENPRVMYMHIGGEGPEEKLAAGIRAVLDVVAGLRGQDPAAAHADLVPNTLDTARLAGILGHAGEMSRGVYKITISRPDVSVSTRRVPVVSFTGFNTWAAFQGTPEEAAVAGDFAMLEEEVGAVVESLVGRGIEIVSLHNHMVHEEPRVVFLHYWGRGAAEDLARAIRAALETQGAVPGG